MLNSYTVFREAANTVCNTGALSTINEEVDDEQVPPPTLNLIPRCFDRVADEVLLPTWLVSKPAISVSAPRGPSRHLDVTKPSDRAIYVQIHQQLLLESAAYKTLWDSYAP